VAEGLRGRSGLRALALALVPLALLAGLAGRAPAEDGDGGRAGADAATDADSTTDWRLVREEDGVALSRRDGDLPTFRGVTVVDESLPQVLAVLRDVPRHVEWRSGCVEARVLGRESPSVAILYNRVEGTWPAADRDAVMRSETRVAGPDAARIDVRAIDSPLAPERDGAVRMPVLVGSYALRALGPERTRVEYRMRLSLGGSVPGWLARYAAEDMPIATLGGLRRQARQTRGTYAAFVSAWPEASARGELPRLAPSDAPSDTH